MLLFSGTVWSKLQEGGQLRILLCNEHHNQAVSIAWKLDLWWDLLLEWVLPHFSERILRSNMDSAEENWSTVLVKSCFKEVEHSEYLCLLVPLLGVSLKWSFCEKYSQKCRKKTLTIGAMLIVGNNLQKTASWSWKASRKGRLNPESPVIVSISTLILHGRPDSNINKNTNVFI